MIHKNNYNNQNTSKQRNNDVALQQQQHGMERISYNNNNIEGLNNISNEYNNTYSGNN